MAKADPVTKPAVKDETPAADTTPAEPKAERTTKPADAKPEPAPAVVAPKVESDCVVRSDLHVGRAVNGKVCSYHAMHYDADGTKRR